MTVLLKTGVENRYFITHKIIDHMHNQIYKTKNLLKCIPLGVQLCSHNPTQTGRKKLNNSI